MSNTILAIDSSIDCCSVAIYKNEYIYSLSEKCKKKHTTKVLPMIQKMLFQTKTAFKELNYISYAKGPGNFTSIRIAASIAQSLSIALKIPIISISTLAIMAEKAWRKYKKKQILVLIKAKKTEFYWAKYKRNKESIWTGEQTESIVQIKSIANKINNVKNTWTLVGNGCQLIEFENFVDIKHAHFFFPNAQDIIPFALLKIKNNELFFFEEKGINYLYNDF